MEKAKKFMEASLWERLTEGKTGLVLMGGAMLSKSLIQFFVDGRGCVPSLFFDQKPNYGGCNEDNCDLIQKVPCTHYILSAPDPTAGYCRLTPPPETPGHSQASLGQSLVGSLFSRVLVHTTFCLCPSRVCFPSPV